MKIPQKTTNLIFSNNKMIEEKNVKPLYDITQDCADQSAKADAGKLALSLVPTQMIKDVAEVRMYGNKKYGSTDNWKKVEMHRYVDALYRHLLSFIDDPDGSDAESGIKHYKHVACNAAFICDMMARRNKK